MKLLTVNFLTCAVRSCKSSLSSSSKSTTSNKEEPSLSSPTTNKLSPFPLHFRDAVLERTDIKYNPRFIQNILPRVNWEALSITAGELGLLGLLPSSNPVEDPAWSKGVGSGDDGDGNGDGDGGGNSGVVNAAKEDGEDKMEVESEHTQDLGEVEAAKGKVLRQLHTLLLETSVSEGKLVCGKCGFEYPIKEGVGNFLLPAHLGQLVLFLHLFPIRARWTLFSGGLASRREGGEGSENLMRNGQMSRKKKSKANWCLSIFSVILSSQTNRH
jgi:multifunctional methyltransferase subunit TRM112